MEFNSTTKLSNFKKLGKINFTSKVVAGSHLGYSPKSGIPSSGPKEYYVYSSQEVRLILSPTQLTKSQTEKLKWKKTSTKIVTNNGQIGFYDLDSVKKMEKYNKMKGYSIIPTYNKMYMKSKKKTDFILKVNDLDNASEYIKELGFKGSDVIGASVDNFQGYGVHNVYTSNSGIISF